MQIFLKRLTNNDFWGMKIIKIRQHFLYVQFVVHILFGLFIYLFSFEESSTLFLIISLWFLISFGVQFGKEIRYAKDFHPFHILMLSSLQFVGVNGLSIWSRLEAGEEVLFGAASVNHVLVLGAFYLSLQHVLVFVGFHQIERRYAHCTEYTYPIYEKIKSSKINYFSWAKRIYALVWSLRLLNGIVPLGAISSLLLQFADMGQTVTLLLILFANIQNKKIGLKLHWIIVLIEIALVLGVGMKENIIRNIVPYAIYLFVLYKQGIISIRPPLITKLLLLSVFVLLVFSYISVFRSIVIRTGKEWAQVSIAETMHEFGDYLTGEGYYSSERKGQRTSIDYLTSRAGAIACNAWAIDYAQRRGAQPAYLYHCAVGIVPRFLFPNKPRLQVGGMIFRLSMGEENALGSYIDQNTSSSSIGFIGSCYFSLGFLGALIIPLFLGYFASLYWTVLKKSISYNILAIWAFFLLISVYLKDFEAFQDCGITFVVWASVYMTAIYLWDLIKR